MSEPLPPRAAPDIPARSGPDVEIHFLDETVESLAARLASHRLLSGAPPSELAWLARHGVLVRIPAGQILIPRGMVPPTVDEQTHPRALFVGLWAVFSGRFAVYIDRGAGPRRAAEWSAGDISGVLPYSRITQSIGDSVSLETGEVFLLPAKHFPELIRECPQTTTLLVHVMLDRARLFVKSDLHDEKMVSLGKLSAGLAHELNNPASAAARDADRLDAALTELSEAARAVGEAGLDAGQWALLTRFREQCGRDRVQGVISPLERADREEALAGWLADRNLEESCAVDLAESDISGGMLDELAAGLPDSAVPSAIRWIAADCAARMLAGDIRQTTARIHDLVSAIKRYTYMDRAASPEPVDIAQGLRDTVAVLRAKARGRDAEITIDIPEDLPHVIGIGGELNQVWSNLLDNAIDAVAPGGHITITARAASCEVHVSFVDDGQGIPADLLDRIFDPFFTTKPVGAGTGLGLDISRRLIRQHDGELVVESRPGRTEFLVRLPQAR